MTTIPTQATFTPVRSFWLGIVAYLLPTFPFAYAWHLVWFAPSYEGLGIYRPDLFWLDK